MVVDLGQTWPFGEMWHNARVRVLLQAPWRPDADLYETATAIEVIVDLAGIADDDLEVQLFEDAVVVEGRRQLPAAAETALYHAASIRQGPFRLELRLPAPIDPDAVEAHDDRGLLRITLPKRRGAA